jgi:hypothetical protein
MATGTWKVVGEMPLLRQRFGAAAVDGRIIAVGGEETPTTAVMYDPSC